MRRLAAILLLCLGVSAGRAAPREDLGPLSRRVRGAAVGLACRGPQGRYFGTGTVIRADGVILTSSTVLPPGASDIRVSLSDGRILTASLLKVDTATELALARVYGVDLPFLPLGRSEDCVPGEIVLTLGNAFGTAAGDGQVSVGGGVLSGIYTLSETRSESTYKGRVFETDAPLNPGSDGGALVDAGGALIGVLCLNYSAMRYLGTAVPIDVLRDRITATVGDVPSAPAQARRMALDRSVLDAWRRRVVAIEVTRTDDVAPRSAPPMQGGPRNEAMRARHPGILSRSPGTVSGVCIGSGGRILTSWYNVAGAVERIRARDVEGVWVPCELLAAGEVDDTAVLQAQGGAWAPAVFEDGAAIEPGRAVFVMGRSPDPEAVTITRGIVSAAERNNGRFFQHDAAANAGNSGGAIIDRAGRLLGITCYVGHTWPDWAMNSGIGFGVRPERVVAVLADVDAGKGLAGWDDLPFLGVRRLVEAAAEGPVVIDVVEGFAAQKAGLEAGDTIVRIEEVGIASWDDIIRTVNTRKAGDTIRVTVRRRGEEKTFEVVLAARPRGL